MNFFVIYVALPCLFYQVLAQAPIEELEMDRLSPVWRCPRP